MRDVFMTTEDTDRKETPASPSVWSGGRVQSLIEQYETVRQELGRATAERDALRRKMAHLEERLNHTLKEFQQLESVLADPEQSLKAIVYYRLRAVWSICHQQLATLADQTTRKLMEPDRRRHEKMMQEKKQEQRQAIESRRSQIVAERATILASVRHLEEELVRHGKLFQKLTRRGLERSLVAAQEKLIPYDARLKELEQELERFENEPLPPYPGLPVAVRREINLLLIALAQQNYLLFREDNVADQALKAHRETVTNVYLGTPSECQALDRSVRESLMAFRSRSIDTSKIRRRAAYLKTKVRYASDDQTVPISETLNSIADDSSLSGDSRGAFAFDQPVPVNVYALDYWNLQSVLVK